MKIMVFGGAGDMGSRAVEALAQAPDVEHITIADKNVRAARALAERLACHEPKLEVREIDANEHHALVAAMRGCSVAISALGPFYVFESKLVAAALEAGVDYASICDDWLAAEQLFEQFSLRARQRNVKILTGLGTSPGISNVGIRFFADRMDSVDRADVYVYMPLRGGGGPAVIRHTLFIMSGKVPAWRDGKRVMLRACSEHKVVDFPRFGPQDVWNMGHSEPVTIPRFIPGIREVNFYMGFGSGSQWLVMPARIRMFDRKGARRVFEKILMQIERLTASEEPEWGAVRIEAWGKKNGKDVHETGFGIGQMRNATGLSLAVGGLMLGRGEVLTPEAGVFGPEGCLDPVTFLGRMKELGITAYSDIELTKPVV